MALLLELGSKFDVLAQGSLEQRSDPVDHLIEVHANGPEGPATAKSKKVLRQLGSALGRLKDDAGELLRLERDRLSSVRGRPL